MHTQRKMTPKEKAEAESECSVLREMRCACLQTFTKHRSSL
jgi:hypothetical protein